MYSGVDLASRESDEVYPRSHKQDWPIRYFLERNTTRRMKAKEVVSWEKPSRIPISKLREGCVSNGGGGTGGDLGSW